MTVPQEAALPRVPDWFTEGIAARYRAEISSVFIVHGDINCLVPNPNGEAEPKYPYIPLAEFFKRVFDEREMVIFYDIATGLRFLSKEMEKQFRKVSGLQSEEDAAKAEKDAVAAAKAGLAAKRKLPVDPDTCLPLIEKVLSELGSVAVIIESAHLIAPESSGPSLQVSERTHIARMRAWAQDSRVKKKSNIVLLLTDLAAKVSGELRQSSARIGSVFIPKPSVLERRFYIERQAFGIPREREITAEIDELQARLNAPKGDKTGLAARINELEAELDTCPPHFTVSKDFDIDVFVNATQGMSLRQILEMFRMANQAGTPIDLLFVKAKKNEILTAEYGDVMEIVDPQWTLDEIGGLEKVKAYFANVIKAITKNETRLIPQGVTLMGPPGTGKTALGQALAKGAGFNFVRLKNARSMWVGQSEERTERQIQGLWALAPVIVMNDEVDLGEANRDSPKGDSGVSERIMRAWMEFLSDARIRGRILMINCTNRPDRMDAALKRSGRSDDRIPLLMPTERELASIFGVMFKRYKIETSIKDFIPFATLVSGRSGADIEAIVLKSFRFAGELEKKVVDDEALRASIDDFIPSASQADIDLMTLLAISESSSRRLLPDNAAAIVDEIKERNVVARGAEIIAQIEARNILRAA